MNTIRQRELTLKEKQSLGELEYFKHLLKTFPKGILSVVSDTFDLWSVLTKTLPQLKEEVLARNGKLVIRPDSGDPVDIICGGISYIGFTVEDFERDRRLKDGSVDTNYTPFAKGLIELLWDTFGGTINSQGYKVLDSHIGAIYGDSITLERAEQICERLKVKGFASTNIVLGVGSFSMGYATRDQQGGAVKSTAVEINGELVEIFKDPITDDGTKKSAKGLLAVYYNDDMKLTLYDQVDQNTANGGELKLILKNGEFVKETTITEIREKLAING